MARNAIFYDYLDLLDKPEGTFCTRSHGQSPARGRNMIIEQALKHNATHIMFFDDDVAFAPHTLKKLLARDKDIVSGLYLMRSHPHKPIMFSQANDDGKCHHYPLKDEDKGLVEIVACGLGACLIKTDVFRALEKPYVRLGELEKDGWCDDLGLWKRTREAGFKLYCDLDVPIGHMCSTTVWPNHMNGKWLVSYDTAGKELVSFPMNYEERMRVKKELVEA